MKKGKKVMKIAKTITQYIITIIIAIAMILFLVINLATSTILKESYILSKLEETNYYDQIYEDVKSNFEKYIYQSGLEENVLEGIITKEKIKKDTQLIINNLYDGLVQKIDTQEIKDNMNKNIEKTLKSTQINATQRKAIDTLIEEICTEYTRTISHYEYEKQINDLYQKVMKYVAIIKKVLLISMAIGIILLLILNKNQIYKAFCLGGIFLTISGVFFIIVHMFLNAKIKVQTILILNEAISNILKSILTHIFNTIHYEGYIMSAIGILLIILSNLIHNKLKYKED